jgi:hypothetical protein
VEDQPGGQAARAAAAGAADCTATLYYLDGKRTKRLSTRAFP